VPGAGNPQALNRYSYVLNNPVRFADPSGHCMDDGEGQCVRDENDRVILREEDWERAERTTDGRDPVTQDSSKEIPHFSFWEMPFARPGLGPVQFGPTQLQLHFLFADIYFSASGFGYKGSSATAVNMTPSTVSVSTPTNSKLTVGQNGTVSTSSQTSSSTIDVGGASVQIANSTVGGIQYDPPIDPAAVQIVVGQSTTVTKTFNGTTTAAVDSSTMTVDLHPLNLVLISTAVEYAPVLLSRFVSRETGFAY
jgi:hypothetical protein